MDWTLWMMFVVTELALCATPGLVVSQGLRCGSADALWAAVGILTANALYFAVSGTGVGALLFASGPLFTVVKWAGAAYVLYLGAVALLRPTPLPGANGTADGADSEHRTLFLRGFLL